MKNHFKLLLVSLLFFISAAGLKAQEKYDYAVVKYWSPQISNKPGIYISISGKEFEKIEVKKEEVKDLGNDYSPLLNYIRKLTNDEWRVINTTTETPCILFILEKKRN